MFEELVSVASGFAGSNGDMTLSLAHADFIKEKAVELEYPVHMKRIGGVWQIRCADLVGLLNSIVAGAIELPKPVETVVNRILDTDVIGGPANTETTVNTSSQKSSTKK